MIPYKYGDHELQTVGVYQQAGKDQTKWIVFIHGGAWRDPNNTFRDADLLFESIAGRIPNVGLASIDYRLSPEVRHPKHQEDVVSGLNYLAHNFGAQEVVLVGHSAGAFLSLQALGQSVLKCQMVICTEGIYDLPSLADEYPDYHGFIENAFGPEPQAWKEASPLRQESFPFSGTIVIVHSDEDELLSCKQPDFAQTAVEARGVRVFREKASGQHDEVFKSKTLCDVVVKYAFTSV